VSARAFEPAARRPPTQAAFREALGRFATGVTVVTTTHDGRRHGMTVNSLTSVSLDPMLVLFCCLRDAVIHEPLLAAGQWAVSILAAGQEGVARCFTAREAGGVDQFDEWPVRAGRVIDAPLLEGAVGHLECRTWATYDGGDHTIVVGEVLDLASGPAGDPLLYDRRRYRTLPREA
jgi:flavin reductase